MRYTYKGSQPDVVQVPAVVNALAARAPLIRNRDAIQMWFDDWNLANERARDAYDYTMSLLEAPRLCRKKLHELPEDAVKCGQCRNQRERERRGLDQPWARLTEEQAAEVIRLYCEERLSIRRVSNLLGIRWSLVRSTLRTRDIYVRSLSEAASLRHGTRSGAA